MSYIPNTEILKPEAYSRKLKQEKGDPMLEEMIYTVDEAGNLLVLESRETLHLTRSSKRHAAVIGMIQHKDGAYLVQWRAANKLGGSRLDVSATTHVREHESYEKALQRSFENELRIKQRVPLKHAFNFQYEEEWGNAGRTNSARSSSEADDGKYEPNPEEIDSLEFMRLDELKNFVRDNEAQSHKVAQRDCKTNVA